MFGPMALRDEAAGILGAARCGSCGEPCGPLCLRCREKLRPPSFRETPPEVDRVVCGWDYSGPARALILGLKLRGERPLAAPAASALAVAVRREGLRASVLTWVPGRRKDNRRRGFDHAAELVRRLSLELGVPALPLLYRRVDRPDQAGLSAPDRRLNLIGSFAAREAPSRVAVVDDLVTTGATATACALALRRAGAREVELLAACSAR